MNKFDSIFFRLRNKIKIEKHKGNTIQLGKKVKIRQCQISIFGENNRIHIDDHANLRGVSLEIVGRNCQIYIGKYALIGQNCYLSAKEEDTTLSIGDRTCFSRNIDVLTSDGHDIYNALTNERVNHAKDVLIKENVWICDGVTILKGCVIGENSVIGLRSLVTSNIPPQVVAVGAPAKVVKENTTWRFELTY